MALPTDRELLIDAAGGRESAFAELYGRYAGELRAYFVRSLDGNVVADDLVQQVFIQLLGSRAFREPQAGPAKLDKLLFTIAKNLLRNQLRDDRRRNDRELAYHGPMDEAPPDRSVDTKRLEEAISNLPSHQRQPLLLRFRHGMQVQAIADLLDCAPGTVKSRLHYGLKRLAHLLQPLAKPDKESPR
ncbi:RNA polymerase sigma factor [Lewinella sp. IMCC34183]|uniref:RNA polymerase sigma factor n=1 Tax=Lewinella sp. IMCC34183 TaxID=2248762 RepID=UPI0013006ECC|nr:sigma-70 family RNA polymerase sigma factor [Lewinella sp. IMCC34183]